MQTVDPLFMLFVLTFTGQDIVVQLRIGKSQLVFVRHAGETVGRSLFHQLFGKAQGRPHLQDLMDHKGGNGRKVSRRIAVLGGIAHIVFGQVAGIDNAAALRQHLGHRIKSGHAEPGGQIDPGFPGHFGGAGDLLQVRIGLKHPFHSLKAGFDIHFHIGDPDGFHQHSGIGNIGLNSVGHQNAQDSLFPQGRRAQGRCHRGILSSGDPDDRAAGGAVLLKVFSDPCDDFVSCLFRILQHSASPLSA